MTSTPHFVSGLRPRLAIIVTLSALCLVPEALAAKASKAKMKAADGDDAADVAVDAKPNKRDDKANARNDAAGGGDAEARQLSRLRERLEVEDDAEWKVITDRIARVEDLRRGLTARATPKGNATVGDKSRRNGRASASSELEALRSAVTDQYPEAEIKARLARAHEVRLQQEEQLVRAQTDLRSVLTVRQEAIMVMMGLLPP